MKMYHMCQAKSAIIILALFLMITHTGCGLQNGNPTPTVATDLPAVSPSLPATMTLTASLTPKPTTTMPPTPTRTATPTVVPTWTPVPTLAPDAALDALLQLYNDNGGCELPCWWGITPGETTWDEARSKLAALGKIDGPWGEGEVVNYEFSFDWPEELDPLGLGYFSSAIGVRDNVVVGITINSSDIRPDFDHSLAGFLRAFGSPDEVWLQVVTDSQKPHYEIHLFYTSKGIMIAATGFVQMQGTTLSICPQEFRFDSFPPALLLWDTSMNIQPESALSSAIGYSPSPPIDKFYLLEDWSEDFDREDFYGTYIDPSTTACFNVDPDNLP